MYVTRRLKCKIVGEADRSLEGSRGDRSIQSPPGPSTVHLLPLPTLFSKLLSNPPQNIQYKVCTMNPCIIFLVAKSEEIFIWLAPTNHNTHILCM